MDPFKKITKKFTTKFGSKVIISQYFHRKTGLQSQTLSALANDDRANYDSSVSETE